MRTLLNEIKLIDDHIFKQATHEGALLFDAMLIINPGLSEKVMWQKKTHGIVRQYGQKQLKAEIEAVHQQLFNNPMHRNFRERILNWFNLE